MREETSSRDAVETAIDAAKDDKNVSWVRAIPRDRITPWRRKAAASSKNAPVSKSVLFL
jgi:hypothetical protein